MKVFISLFCVAFVCISQSSSSCPDGWTRHGSTCYHFSHDTESMPVAAVRQPLFCPNCVSTTWRVFGRDRDRRRRNLFVCTGATTGSDIQEEGTWLWYGSKTPLRTTGYTNWGPSQPDNYKGDENCVILWKGKGQWGDNPCHNFWRYICEKADQSAEIVG